MSCVLFGLGWSHDSMKNVICGSWQGALSLSKPPNQGKTAPRYDQVIRRPEGNIDVTPSKHQVWCLQGSVNVPSWGFWTSPLNICWQLYPQKLGDVQLGHLPTPGLISILHEMLGQPLSISQSLIMSQDMMQWKKHVKKDIAGNISDWWMLTAQFVVISFFYSKTRGHQINPRNCQFYSRDSIVCLNSLHVSWCFTFFFPG